MPSAARVRWAKFRTAAVSVVALLILGVLLYLLTGGTLLKEKATIYMYIPDATGLSSESPVRVNGISAGKISAVELSGSNQPNRVVKVTMTMTLQTLASITDDAYAQTSTDSLIGDKYVDISTGRSPGRLKPGGELTYKAEPDMLKSLDMKQLEATFRTVDTMLTEIEQGTSRVGRFVQGEDMYRDLLRRVADLQQGLNRAVSTTSTVGKAVYGDDVIRSISDPLRQIDQSLARLQSGQGSAGQFLRDPAQYEKLRRDLQDFRRAIADLHSQEFLQSDRQYAEWNRSLDSLMQKVDEFNAGPMFGPSASYDNLTGLAKELQESIKDFRENPKKYMRLKIF